MDTLTIEVWPSGLGPPEGCRSLLYRLPDAVYRALPGKPSCRNTLVVEYPTAVDPLSPGLEKTRATAFILLCGTGLEWQLDGMHIEFVDAKRALDEKIAEERETRRRALWRRHWLRNLRVRGSWGLE